jgi:hypothetical protein
MLVVDFEAITLVSKGDDRFNLTLVQVKIRELVKDITAPVSRLCLALVRVLIASLRTRSTRGW